MDDNTVLTEMVDLGMLADTLEMAGKAKNEVKQSMNIVVEISGLCI